MAQTCTYHVVFEVHTTLETETLHDMDQVFSEIYHQFNPTLI